ncbi:glucosamine-6-phosphate isomerase 1-like [Watersipora subatra]|uniref:glucosamine-6-phosphate isomerase 1-like n=1 Tax=Watersipora subatra TaxID=2589382 RepID=UPI00355C2F27
MRLVIESNKDQVATHAAQYVVKQIKCFQPGPSRYYVLGLPTGSTPLGMYSKLVEYYKQGEISFQYVRTFNMDEYCAIPRDHPESYHSFMWNNFFKHIDIPSENVNILDGNAEDLQKECQLYEEKIKAAGGIDLFIGGVGDDGHIAFNEPGSSLVSRTRLKTLARTTVEANKRFFDGNEELVPKQALTVGVGTIMDARQVMILITGGNKAYALKMAVEEGVSHMWTVSALQQHPKVLFIVDEDATSELRVATYKYFKSLQECVEATHQYC